MFRCLLLLLILISPALNAQIQSWTKDEIIDHQFMPARKAQKTKKAINYITGENWQVADSSNYNEVTYYNKNGQKTVFIKYKTDWVKKTRYYQYMDSVFYTDKGIFSEYKRYSPKGNNTYYECTYRAVTTINKKEMIERIDYYGGYHASELTDYELRAYDKKGRLATATKYLPDGKEDYKWTFEYDTKNRVKKITTSSPMGSGSRYELTYNKKGQLLTYTEFFEKEEQSKATYGYDADHRCTGYAYTSPGFESAFTYWYEGKAVIPHRSYLKYPRGYGTNELAHEYLVYMFEYFE